MRHAILTVGVLAAALATACHRNDNDAASTPPASSTMAGAPAAPSTMSPAANATPPKADAQMQAVLDQLAKLGGKPIETLTPDEARMQPSPADAVKALLESQGKPTTPEPVAKVEDRTIPGAGGPIPIRIYTPEGKGPMPVVLYIHGGGWVIANLDTYDASPRALANASGAIIVSTHYRQAPEHKFPAAHEDTLAAYKWVLANAAKLGGDAKKIAVVGESAGGNMAADIAIAARDQKLQAPVHQVLVYPVANNDMNSPSYVQNANAKPLNKPMMEWFVKHTFDNADQTADPRIAIAKRKDLAGVAPATIILAEIDPLRSDGEALADALKAAGVDATVQKYDGVTHEFFGMGAAVDKAKDAEKFAGAQLKKAFATP
ncbi:Alpha/beta hydrolase [Lysobacter dokdonensis DS-58]|uniref:Alpha/beta hydrolase n=1 Tax=Lysobacter dokdonensis DS-58 TaxID=1300345 RepID=A0A0A2WJQ3_9GAMM|nr:alpha/beta hydrolase [Lysobacter dokdonensis]KGQ18490.1 Alpha/beta hydrolase [Lysobacter dokdonensis DS-58]